MHTNFFRVLTLSIVLVSFTTSLSHAQDVLNLKSGDRLEGKITVLYSDEFLNDYIEIKQVGIEQTINADDVASFTIDYKMFIPMQVNYYSSIKEDDVSRTILASNILEGELSLWKYEGFGFSFVLERAAQFYPLQKGNKLEGQGDTYKTVLIAQAGEYFSIQEISKFKYSTISFIIIVNEFNSQRNSNYVPKSTSINYLKENKVGVYVGSSLASTDFKFLNYRRPCSSCPKTSSVSFVEADDDILSLNVSIFKRWNLNKIEPLDLQLDVSIQYYSFNIESSNQNRPVNEELMSIESLVSFGPNYRLPFGNRFSTSFSIQPTMFYRLNTMSVSTMFIDIYDRGYAKNFGLGVNVATNFEYTLNNSLQLFVRSSKLFRDTETFFIGNVPKDEPGSSVEFNEYLHFAIGIRILTLK